VTAVAQPESQARVAALFQQGCRPTVPRAPSAQHRVSHVVDACVAQARVGAAGVDDEPSATSESAHFCANPAWSSPIVECGVGVSPVCATGCAHFGRRRTPSVPRQRNRPGPRRSYGNPLQRNPHSFWKHSKSCGSPSLLVRCSANAPRGQLWVMMPTRLPLLLNASLVFWLASFRLDFAWSAVPRFSVSRPPVALPSPLWPSLQDRRPCCWPCLRRP
jgi:hypothetical protein